MAQIKKCPFCDRTIPQESIFCPYCGQRMHNQGSDQKQARGLDSIITKVSSLIEQSIPSLRDQLVSVISNLEGSLQQSTLPAFLDKEKIARVLQKLRDNIAIEQSSSTLKEYNTYTSFVKKVISGDKCIVCLQPFNLQPNEKTSVALCPNCSFAAHQEHFVTWLQERNICPMCRAEIKLQNLIIGHLVNAGDDLIFEK
ncbi:MAG: hypothetical protein ACTSYD_14120 [Candidatus Heimdallarchaeaceae archaeon]